MNNAPINETASVLCGCGIALVNVLIAIIAFRVALRQDTMTMFLRIIIGSMAGRTVLTLAIVWYGIKIVHFATIPFIATLLFCYLIGLGAEILLLHRKQLEISRRYYQNAANRTSVAASQNDR